MNNSIAIIPKMKLNSDMIKITVYNIEEGVILLVKWAETSF
jgi:hypothetical protein